MQVDEPQENRLTLLERMEASKERRTLLDCLEMLDDTPLKFETFKKTERVLLRRLMMMKETPIESQENEGLVTIASEEKETLSKVNPSNKWMMLSRISEKTNS